MNFQTEILQLKQTALHKKKSYLKLAALLKKLKPYEVDELFHVTHEEIFSHTDCLACANCCKTTPALLSNEDINRISKHLKLNTKDFIIQYTRKDNDGDTVLKTTPCVFLDIDNKCKIYEIRPFACKDYPHTNRKKMQSILNLTLKNTEICPAVQRILDAIENSLE